jgi:hypothetical protein
MYKKKTLRHMQPITRRYARVVNDLDGVLRRLRNLTQEVARLELDASALYNQHTHEVVMKQAADLDKEITWEKVSTTHVILDPQTGETETDGGSP